MNNSLVTLAKKRQRLVEESQMQRVAVANQLQAWHKPISMLDYAINMLRYVKQHPVLVASGGSALLSMFKPNALSLWLQRGLLAWQILSKFRKKQQNNK
ncbi:YqjK-like protein [Methylophilaceae bacterium]